MAFTFLPALQPRDKHAIVRVHVSRKWEFRGGSDDGALQYIDMVLANEQVSFLKKHSVVLCLFILPTFPINFNLC